MPVDRSLWTPPFRKLPSWPCPTCAKGILLEKDNSVVIKETGPSRKAHDEDDWDPDWIVERFSGFLFCNNPECEEVVSIAGTSGNSYYHDIDVDGHIYQTVDNDLVPLMIYPPPHLFAISDQCPPDVASNVVDAFEVIWSDHESAANKFRIAIENLLTSLKIPTYTKAAKGKSRSKLSLHSRILRYKIKNAEVAELLEAVKWLGNHGSHANSSLSLENVFTAADIIEHVFEKLYGRPQNVINIARKINKQKGPV